jgi:macrolide transport system ATP-binding/permease protein
MLALGRGAEESISERLSSLGSNLLTVRSGSGRRRGVSLGAGSITRLTVEDADAIARVPEVRRVASTVYGRAQLVYGNKNWNSTVQGTGVDYAEMRASVPAVGTFFTRSDVKTRQKVAVLGATIVEELFGTANPIGSSVRINRISFRVIGVLPQKGASHWRDYDDIVIIPVTTAMYRLLGKKYVDSIDVEIRQPDLVERAEEAISAVIMKRHRLGDNKEESFSIRNMSEIREAVEGTARTMAWLLGSIAAISLLVGGIGIMNIMLVSVTERTREIGLRKAVGARKADVMTQFLIESVVMTLIGGVAGILLGSGIAVLLATLADWPVKISEFSIALATGFSVTIGLVFGIWPAYHASKLNPIEALRYE